MSRWFSKKDYKEFLHEDLKLRRDLKERLAHAGVANIEIERAANKLKVNIWTSRPGIIIGRRGSEVDKVVDVLSDLWDRGVLTREASQLFRGLRQARNKAVHQHAGNYNNLPLPCFHVPPRRNIKPHQ